MNKLSTSLSIALSALVAIAPSAIAQAPRADLARWEAQAKNVTVTRDDWGIAHVHGKTDADAVFGVMYAQAEDDFNRVESNYLDAIGLRAQVDGKGEIYRDLRVRLFVDPDELKTEYQKAPQWLKALMNA